jgi:hypothetical protein
MKHPGWLFGAVLLVQQTAAPRLAVPVEPVVAIVDALRSHDVVAMGAGQAEARTRLGSRSFVIQSSHGDRRTATVGRSAEAALRHRDAEVGTAFERSVK